MTMNPPIRRIRISHRRLKALVRELGRRGQGNRESGAFLLAPTKTGVETTLTVTAIAFYDDLDPNCLTGGITFNAVGYSALGALCRDQKLRVIADVHTHPASWVQQSDTDARHPMAALPGHVALIAPNYAQGQPGIENFGVHSFDGTSWQSYFLGDVHQVVDVRGINPIVSGLAAFRRVLRSAITATPERSSR
jgi:proteasome lid subunit RPN8/RPN11